MRLLTAICLGTAVYVFVSLFGGQDGLWAASQLLVQRREINEQTSRIISLNKELSIEYAALKQDPGMIASYARKLGYVNDNEKLVKITGLPVRYSAIYDPGTVLKRQEIACIPEWICKLSGVAVSALTFMVLMLINALRPRER